MRWMLVFLCLLPAPVAAETVVAARTIRAQTILTAQDLAVQPGGTGDVTVADLVGQEARVALYAGRPVARGDVGPPAVVDRNQIVPLIYEGNGLSILTEGRALGRAAMGEYVRVMNLVSRSTVTGRVTADGRIRVAR